MSVSVRRRRVRRLSHGVCSVKINSAFWVCVTDEFVEVVHRAKELDPGGPGS